MNERQTVGKSIAFLAASVLAFACPYCPCRGQAIPKVGPQGDGGVVVPTEQLIHPPGKSVAFHGRPVDLAMSPDGKTVFAKSNASLLVIDAESWAIRQELKYPAELGGASMHGVMVSPDGKKIYVSLQSYLVPASISADGKVAWEKRIPIPGATSKRDSYPCGMAMISDNRAAVCLSMSNTLAIVNLSSGRVEKEIDVGIAPYAVTVSPDHKTAYVSNWGGRRARANDRTAKSASNDVVVDVNGTASTGNVGVVDLSTKKEVAEIETGLHPADVLLAGDGKTLYVANSNSDTVSVIDTASRTVRQTINVRPDANLLFGSMSNALALSADGQTLFVADGGNNAVAVVDLSATPASVKGFIPTGWYPGALLVRDGNLFVANVKGIGSRHPADEGKWSSHSYWGTIGKVAVPDAATLADYTKKVLTDSLVPQTLLAQEKAQRGVTPVPVPAHVGEPSVIQHVIYIVKENRTYDQVMGDMPRGNNDPNLCIFGRKVTPNQHAIADQFALLDNYYCNGVLSADGHAWAMEGVAVDYLEKSFGGWSRSYPFPGDDALAIAPTGFIWDDVLMHGLSFRNYGEMSTTHPEGGSTWLDIYNDWKSKNNKVQFTRKLENDTLRRYSCADSPGWNLHITDQIRADVFLKEFSAAEKLGRLANLTVLYLPQDHTFGAHPGEPTAAAMVADNDLAVGRVIDAVSHSKFWATTCVFVNEDDPQAGFDHVDGHRSFCLIASPYTKRNALVSNFYNQCSVLHTIELMLGCPPMNQFDAMAPAMREVFTDKPDLAPFSALPNVVPLDQMGNEKASLSGKALEFAQKSEKLRFDLPDLADEDTLNRIIWYSVKGDAAYPAKFAGPHGRGLKALHLKLDGSVGKDDDDD